jgi:hypothetical protein
VDDNQHIALGYCPSSLQKRAGQPQGEALGRMKPLSRRSWSWIFSSANSFGGIRYGLFEIGAVPG